MPDSDDRGTEADAVDASPAGRRPPAQQFVALVVLLGLTFSAAVIGGLSTATSVHDWYPQLAKPQWTPPDWVFGPVWTALYLTMTISAWLIWRQGGWSTARPQLTLFFMQLALNVGWSVLFFGMRNPGAALLAVVALLAGVGGTVVAFWRRSALAAGLLVPYLIWVAFAAVLNFAIWTMN